MYNIVRRLDYEVGSYFDYTSVGDENLLKMEHCHFTGNQGLGTQGDFGAAVALSFQITLREQESLRQHEVVDWCVYACVCVCMCVCVYWSFSLLANS